MDSNVHIDEIAAIISRATAEAEARGYERGQADAKREMLALLTRTSGGVHQENSVPEGSAERQLQNYSEIPADERKRAPKGIVPKFVTRVLAENPGLTPKEFLQFAVTEYEKMIKPESIRSELNAGKGKGRYRTEAGKWFPAEDAGGAAVAGKSPPDPEQDEEGGDTHAAALGHSVLD